MGDIMAVASFFFSSFVTVFFVVDPPAAVPLFISMTATYPADEKRRTAMRASLIAFVVLSVFAAAGGAIFRLLHVSLGAFRMAGGLLLFLLAVDMLRAQRSRQRTSPEERPRLPIQRMCRFFLWPFRCWPARVPLPQSWC